MNDDQHTHAIAAKVTPSWFGLPDHPPERHEALTELELDVIRRLGLIWNDICNIVGTELSREGDLNEAIVHIHALQQMIMSQAAGRAYPETLRLLGGHAAGRLPTRREP